jgi:NAD-dependent deacetylase
MTDKEIQSQIQSAATLIRDARHLTAFTGAGMSVESGIPPFRGAGGLWDRYDQRILELSFFLAHPEACWPVIREIFYDHFAKAEPNRGHAVLAELEAEGRLKALVTQNIDDLHTRAGNRAVIEFHGNSRLLVCLDCGKRIEASSIDLSRLPPRCVCGGVYKPDFIFFGEGIPPRAQAAADEAARRTDCMLVIGSTGEVYPAAGVPQTAARRGAIIIEINPEPSTFTDTIAALRLAMPAARALDELKRAL